MTQKHEFKSNYNYLKWFFGFIFAYMLFFTMHRVVFLIWFNTINYPVLSLLKSFFIGARYDFSIVSTFILTGFLLAAIILLIPKTKILARIIFTLWLGIANTAILFLSVAEFPFYANYTSRLNHLFFEYLTDPKELIVTLSGIVPLIPMAILFVLVGLVMWYLGDQISRAFTYGAHDKVWLRMLLIVFMAGIILVGIRGGVQRRPLNWGEAFFSSHNFLNQLALNGSYNLLAQAKIFVKEQQNQITSKRFYTEGEAREIIAQIKKREPAPNPVIKFDSKPNVVVIVMESFAPKYIGAMGAPISMTPNFDDMVGKGIFFTSFYAAATRTSRALTSLLLSYPPLPGVNLTKKVEAQQFIPSVAYYMNKQGYTSLFLYGGDKNFEGMAGFFTNSGFQNFYGSERLKGIHYNPIGLYDEDLFNNAVKLFNNQGNPFFAVIMTLTNHGPYTVPDYYAKEEKNINKKELLAFKYSDYALGKFFEEAQKRDWYKNTVFFITSDHSALFHDFDETRFKIPMLIYSPLITERKEITSVASQLDFAPSLLNMLGLDGAQNFIGSDFSSNKGYAYILDDPYFGMFGTNNFYRENLNGTSYVFTDKISGQTNYCDSGSCDKDMQNDFNNMRTYSRAVLDLSRDLFFQSRAKELAVPLSAAAEEKPPAAQP